MAATLPLWRPTPKGDEGGISVSQKGLAEPKGEAEEGTGEDERLRREFAERRRPLQVHENPSVPPSMPNHSPGSARARPQVGSGERKKPGPTPGGEGAPRDRVTPDPRVPSPPPDAAGATASTFGSGAPSPPTRSRWSGSTWGRERVPSFARFSSTWKIIPSASSNWSGDSGGSSPIASADRVISIARFSFSWPAIVSRPTPPAEQEAELTG